MFVVSGERVNGCGSCIIDANRPSVSLTSARSCLTPISRNERGKLSPSTAGLLSRDFEDLDSEERSLIPRKIRQDSSSKAAQTLLGGRLFGAVRILEVHVQVNREDLMAALIANPVAESILRCNHGRPGLEIMARVNDVVGESFHSFYSSNENFSSGERVSLNVYFGIHITLETPHGEGLL